MDVIGPLYMYYVKDVISYWISQDLNQILLDLLVKKVSFRSDLTIALEMYKTIPIA